MNEPILRFQTEPDDSDWLYIYDKTCLIVGNRFAILLFNIVNRHQLIDNNGDFCNLVFKLCSTQNTREMETHPWH